MLNCPVCGAPTFGVALEVAEKHYIITCPTCAKRIRSCQTCAKAQHCLLQENPDNIERHFSQQTSNGYIMTINPEIAKHYCNKDKCVCGVNGDCLRELCQICDNWEPVEELLQI